MPGLLLLPSKKSRLRPAQYNSQYNSQYSTQIAQKRAISESSTSGVPPVPWVVEGDGQVLEEQMEGSWSDVGEAGRGWSQQSQEHRASRVHGCLGQLTASTKAAVTPVATSIRTKGHLPSDGRPAGGRSQRTWKYARVRVLLIM